MTHVFDEEGRAVPVTVIDVSGNSVVQVKKTETDGYAAVQLGVTEQKEQRLSKPAAGHFKKHGSAPRKYVREFRVDSDDNLESVDDIDFTASMFADGQWVDVIGTSKGRGFQGAVRRHGFGGLRMTHGSMMHRRTGAIGAGSTPGRVWKGTKMPGRLGNDRKTVQNLKVVQSRPDENVLLIEGAVPGSKGSYVIVRPAVKKALPDNWPPKKQAAEVTDANE
jgi:large subunit ribosomal protein L3